jgi:hypothetical protein
MLRYAVLRRGRKIADEVATVIRCGNRNRSVVATVLIGAMQFVAQSAHSQQLVNILPYKGILAVRAPGQLDVATIDAIADVGVKQVVRFPANSDVAGFIAQKCGRPSLTVTVHPRYREKLIAENKTGAAADLNPLVLTEDRTLTLPACASSFALQEAEFEVPNGVQALMQKLSIPFDLPRYQKLTSGQNFTATISEEYKKLAQSPYPEGQVCPAADLVSFFACVNAIELAYFNLDRIKTADQITGKVKVPVAPLEGAQARVPIAAETADQLAVLATLSDAEKIQYKNANSITNLTPVLSSAVAPAVQTISGVSGIKITASTVQTGDSGSAVPALPTSTPASARFLPKAAPAPVAVSGTIEDELKFVTAVEDVTKFDPGCSDAHLLKAGRWPFDANELMRVLALSYSLDPELVAIPRVLVVDTGFDFTYDEKPTLPAPERYIFPRDSFSTNRDRNNTTEDGIKGEHFQFAGVNLAMKSRSSATHVLDMTRRRSHGLAVTTLALGGRDRDLQYLRNLKVLKTKVGIASLVPTNDANVVLNRAHLDRIMQYATAATNDFKIINLSLSTQDTLEGFQSQLRNRFDRVFVAAAGNDNTKGKPLHDPDSALYPAVLGGAPTGFALNDTVVISVGAHKGDGKRAGFSYFSKSKVDLLAPGCMIPSYELQRAGAAWADPPRVVESFVSGTSFAAPLVSFLASVLMSDAGLTAPGIIKERVLVGTDFDHDLRDDAFSSGRLNPAKMLSATFDVLETVVEGTRQIRFGTVKNKDTMPDITCGNVQVPFRDVRKLSFDPARNKVLLMSNDNPFSPKGLQKEICEPSVLQGLNYQFDNAETGELDLSFDAATQVVDYVAKLRR